MQRYERTTPVLETTTAPGLETLEGEMRYHCLICDQPFDAASFPAHAAEHGWPLEQTRQCGYEFDPATRTNTHEFSLPGGPALFWLIVPVRPLAEEADT